MNLQEYPSRHRKRSYSDEPTWVSHIRVPLGNPVKYAGNPILSPRAGKWDAQLINTPCAKKWEGLYYLFYTGQSTSSIETMQVGLYTSTDPLTGWTIHPNSDSTALISAPGSWVGVGHFFCLIDEEESDSDRLWKAYACGIDTGDAGSAAKNVLYFTSPDGIAWTYRQEITDITDLRWGPAVIMIGRKVLIYYRSSADNIRLAESFDGTTFTDRGVVLDVGAALAWDNTATGYDSVFYLDGTLYVPYGGYNGTNWQIGLSMSDMRERETLIKELGNPIIPVGGAGDFDEKHAYSPYLLQEETTFYVYYTGRNASGVTQIGVATFP